MKPFVIAFCGPPGAGKSMQTRTIAALKPDFLTLNYDEFPNRSSQNFRGLRDWFEKSGDPNDFQAPELEARFEALSKPAASDRTPPAILFETPFGRTHRQTGRFIDFLVWIDVPLEVALARQLLTILKQRGDNPTAREYEGFIQGLEGFLKTYVEITITMYKRQAAEVGAGADLTVDGTKSVEEIAQIVIAATAGFIR
jgi:uridine kinase